jgi:predicted ribosome quality control (RQC) complex YloA/Tae2 family protein
MRALTGRVVTAVSILEGERIVRLGLDDGHALILELLGGAGNLFLTSPAGVVETALRPVKRPGGALAAGEAWRPPAIPAGREAAGARVWENVGREAAPLAPGLAAVRATAEFEPLDGEAAASLVVCAHGMPAGPVVFEPARFLGDAVLRRACLRERHLLAAQCLAEWRRRLSREGRRLARLEERQEAEDREAQGGDLALRHQAEALAASLHSVKQEGLTLRVPDPYGEPGSCVEIQINPGESPRAAMDRLFHRAGRLERAREKIRHNLSVTRQRRAEVGRLARGAEDLTREADLLQALGSSPPWLRDESHHRRRAPQPLPRGGSRRRGPGDPRERKVRRYQLQGPWTLLVGGQADVNDYVSFRLAAPADFWLHAADYPGAHVVLRNPRRLTDLPPEVLRRAAEVAAWFSKARGRGPVDVRWTQARYLRKGKGMPVGMVLLPRFSTITVEAAAPPRLPEF